MNSPAMKAALNAVATIQQDYRFPNSQPHPLGPKQTAWVNDKYMKAFFRDGKPLCVCKQDRAP